MTRTDQGGPEGVAQDVAGERLLEPGLAGLARLTRTEAGRAAYARRKTIVESVFGQMTILPRRPPPSCSAASRRPPPSGRCCTCHNLRKLFAARGADGLAGLMPA